MSLNLKKDKIQKEAVAKWIDKRKNGTLEIITGLGKTFIFLHCLYTMPKNKDIHLFLAETTERKKDLDNDIKKYNKIFNRNVYKDYNLEFYCYQTAYKWKNKTFGLVGADEIHDSLSPSYSKFYFNNEYKALLGLSAGINKNVYYPKQNYTKGELLNQICPVIYKYSVDQGQEEGTARKLKIFIIKHQLDNVNKNVKAGNKNKVFYQTEESAYLYWDKQHKRAWFIEDQEEKDLKIRITSNKRKNILYNLESKIVVIKKLISNLIGKSILFGNSLDSLLKITPNVMSSRNNNEKNNKIRNYFDKGLLTLIASFKKLKQGANLVDLDNCIIMSYYSNTEDFIQRIGRLRQNNNLGYIFILVTENTQEQVWFEKMINNINNIDIIYCDNIDDCIKKYLNDKK